MSSSLIIISQTPLLSDSTTANMPRRHSTDNRSNNQIQNLRSACSSASSTIKQVDSTLALLKTGKRVEEEDETQSFSSSHWDTDLEDDALSDDDGDDDDDDDVHSDKETYLKVCDTLGVTPVSRFRTRLARKRSRLTIVFSRKRGLKRLPPFSSETRRHQSCTWRLTSLIAKVEFTLDKCCQKTELLLS